MSLDHIFVTRERHIKFERVDESKGYVPLKECRAVEIKYGDCYLGSSLGRILVLVLRTRGGEKEEFQPSLLLPPRLFRIPFHAYAYM